MTTTRDVINTTKNVMSSATSYLIRLSIIMSPAIVSGHMSDSLLYIYSAFLICLVGYDFVLEEGYGLTPFISSIIGIMYAVTTYLSGSFVWFSFYGLEYGLAFIAGTIVWLVGVLISNLVIGSVAFGNLDGYLNHMEKQHTDNHTDPFGDKHAQRILDD